MCPNYREFKDTISHDCSTLLHVFDYYQDLLISKHALPVTDLLSPQVPPRRSRKKVHKFMSMRESLMDD